MKQVFIISLLFLGYCAASQITTLKPGQEAPGFTLKNVNNKLVSFNDYPAAKGFIIVFTCNTCPVARAYEERIMELDRKFASKGYPVIAINPNDPVISPGDNFEKMQERARKNKYSFVYLFDQGQVVTNLYGARNTPHIFLLKKTGPRNLIEYTGAIDNDEENTNPRRVNFVEQAIAALENNKTPEVTSTKAIGCSVRRKSIQ